MSRKRRHFSPEEKVRILKKCLVENIPVSDVCERLFEKGMRLFEKGVDIGGVSI